MSRQRGHPGDLALHPDRGPRHADPPVELRAVSKVYPGVRALDRVDLTFRAGEVHGVLGQNGAGKSTLIRLLAGSEQSSEGALLLDGEEVSLAGPRDALARGIAVVHQEYQSFMDLSVIENVLVGSRDTLRPWVRWRSSLAAARAALDRVGLEIDPTVSIATLTPAQRKLVEIARALHRDSTRVLLLDEPTAALEAAEAEVVLQCMDRLRRSGAAVVFISHHLDEVFGSADRVTILRDGRSMGTFDTRDVDRREMVELMVGSEFGDPPRRTPVERGSTPRVRVTGWSVGDRVREAGFEVHSGEIVGVCGLVGSGRSELARSLFGALRRSSGTLHLDGEETEVGSPTDAVAAGIAYVPGDRQSDGLVFTMNLRQNMSLAVLRRLARRWGIDRGAERRTADTFADKLRVKAPSLDVGPSALSGGNQQKVLLGRWLATDPRFILLDDPTQGIDIAAKAEVHAIIGGLAEGGMAVLLISSDLEELVTLTDRVLVMRHGHVAAVLQAGYGKGDLLMAMTSAEELIA